MFSENLVEFVDILPTLVEAAGLPELEKCPVDSRDITICREGTSLLRIPEGKYNVIICLSQQPIAPQVQSKFGTWDLTSGSASLVDLHSISGYDWKEAVFYQQPKNYRMVMTNSSEHFQGR